MGRKNKIQNFDFYDNLTLGLIKDIPKNSHIKDFNFEKHLPCKIFEIRNWEERYNIKLPKDMENFYLSSDGLQLTWSFKYTRKDKRPLGYLRIPHLIEITLLHVENDDIVSLSDQHFLDALLSPKSEDRSFHCDSQLKINVNTKIFEVYQVDDLVKICLIYENNNLQPKIYLLELETYQWKFLAESFTQYLRMAIIHFGLPYWELAFSSYGLPPWVQQLFLILAPHRLKFKEKRRKSSFAALREKHYQILDEDIFKMKLIKKKNYKIDPKNH